MLYLPSVVRLTPHLLSPVGDAARQAGGHLQRIPMTLPVVAPHRTSNRRDGLAVDHGTEPATPLLVPPLVADDGCLVNNVLVDAPKEEAVAAETMVDKKEG